MVSLSLCTVALCDTWNYEVELGHSTRVDRKTICLIKVKVDVIIRLICRPFVKQEISVNSKVNARI